MLLNTLMTHSPVARNRDLYSRCSNETLTNETEAQFSRCKQRRSHKNLHSSYSSSQAKRSPSSVCRCWWPLAVALYLTDLIFIFLVMESVSYDSAREQM